MEGLERFVTAQQGIYPRALAELMQGRKASHWMWFVFPQIAGLGQSAMAVRYAIRDLAEARFYLAHPVLGARLREAVGAMLVHAGVLSAEAILGGVDAVKFRSSLTLFEAAAEDEAKALFSDGLAAFYGSVRDPATLARLTE
jgi:uncharacterized protein (DUF1810 family)